MNLTQEQINNLGFNYNCCISKKTEELAKAISRGNECKCKSRKLVFLSSLVDIVNCYKLDQTITHKAERPAFFPFRTDVVITAGSWFNFQISADTLPELEIDGTTFYNGSNPLSPTFTNSSDVIVWVNNEIITSLLNGFTKLYPVLNDNTFLIYSPPGEALNWDSSTIVTSDGSDFTVNGSLQIIDTLTFTSGLNTIEVRIRLGTAMVEGIGAVEQEYTTEELNCLTEDQLQKIIEYINKECDCCI